MRVWQPTLAQRSLLPLLLGFAVIAAVGLTLLWHFYQNHIDQRQLERAKLLAEAVHHAAGATHDVTALQRFVMSMAAEREVVLIVVAVGEPLRVVAASRHTWRGALLEHLPHAGLAGVMGQVHSQRGDRLFSRYQNAEIWVVEPLLYGTQSEGKALLERGVVGVVVDVEAIPPFVVTGLFVTAVLLMALLLLFVTVYAWGLRRHVLQPMQRINAAVLKRAAGDRTALVPALAGREMAEVARAINQMIEEMERARREAEVAEQTKSAFLANVSHELRTPLNAIVGMGELLAESPLDAEQQHHLARLRQAGDHLLALVDDLINLSRLEGGRLQLTCEPFVLRGWLQDEFDYLLAMAREKGLEATLVTNDLPELFVGDRRALRVVLINLIGNAIKFTEQGRVEVEVVRAGADRVRFSVRDTGVGIPVERLQAVREPFAQADESLTRRFGGAGLGLPVAQRLVTLMGGQLEIESRVGEGSTVAFSLPLQCPQSTPQPGVPWHQ